MTTAIYKREKHVAITAVGTGHDLVEAELERRGIQRQVALSLPTLPGLGNLLAHTDLVATVPERVAYMLMRISAVNSLQPPFDLPTFAIKQHPRRASARRERPIGEALRSGAARRLRTRVRCRRQPCPRDRR